MKKVLTLVIIGSLFIIGCKNGCNKKATAPPTEEDSIEVNLGELADSIKRVETHHLDSVRAIAAKETALTQLSQQVLSVFKNKRYAKLDSLIHPEEGIRFSPYATILPSDKKFSRAAFKKLVAANKAIVWGNYDGSGDPILLTPREYFSKFVYDANFVASEQFNINHVIKKGNSINNLKNKYPNSDFTESHFSGTKKSGDMDWKSVRLVFKKKDGKYYLVGIVHDQWTI